MRETWQGWQNAPTINIVATISGRHVRWKKKMRAQKKTAEFKAARLAAYNANLAKRGKPPFEPNTY